jgi:hypothetical protein
MRLTLTHLSTQPLSIHELISDSATILNIPALWDSADTTSVIDSAYVQLKAPSAYIKGIADSTYVKGFANEAYIDAFVDADLINSRVNILDSANVTAFVDSAYVRYRETPQNFAYSALTNPAIFADSAFVTAQINALIGGAPATLNTLDEIALALNDDDSAYGTLITLIGTKTSYDSADTTGIVDSAYVQLKAPAAYIKGIANEAYIDAFVDADLINSRVDIFDSAQILTITQLWDSANTTSVIDSAYVQLKAPAAYIKGIVNEAYIDSFVDADLINSRVDIFDSAQILTITQLWDSADTTGVIDSAYVQLKAPAGIYQRYRKRSLYRCICRRRPYQFTSRHF